jgi:hypothetical protein
LLRNQISEAVGNENSTALEAAKVALEKFAPNDDSLMLCRAFNAYRSFLDGYSYRNETEKKRIITRRLDLLDSGIEELEEYLKRHEVDADAWILLAKMTRAQYIESDKFGWYKVGYEAVTKAILASPNRQDLQFYRAEIVATQFPREELEISVVRSACEGLYGYLLNNPKHARGYRILSALLDRWYDLAASDQLARARDVAALIADEGDGSWRYKHRSWAGRGFRISGAALLILVAMATASKYVAFIPNGITTFLFLCCFVALLPLMYFLTIYVRGMQTRWITTPPFNIESTHHEDEEYDEGARPDNFDNLWPRRPDHKSLSRELAGAFEALKQTERNKVTA